MDMKQLLRYAGNTDQLYGVRRCTLEDGSAKGTSIIEVTTAGGLQVDILVDMGFDIGNVRYKGVNVGFLSKNGYDSTARFSAGDGEFLKTFPGGFLYTCGLRTTGPPNTDNGEYHPLHGRIRGAAASQISTSVCDDHIIVSGVLRETSLFGHCFELHRSIKFPIWGSSIYVADAIKNLTPKTEEFALLYHINLGFPLISEHAHLVLSEDTKTTPRTEHAAKDIQTACCFTEPVDGFEEQVYFHDVPTPTVRVENSLLNMTAELSWTKDTLPVLAQWKSMASGDYVLGLEPTNTYIMGRSAERENGTLKSIGAFGEVRTGFEFHMMGLK